MKKRNFKQTTWQGFELTKANEQLDLTQEEVKKLWEPIAKNGRNRDILEAITNAFYFGLAVGNNMNSKE